MDSVVLQSVKFRGRPLQRTLEPRRKRIRSTKRSGSRKSKHHDHFYQKLYEAQSKPVKTASMLAMMVVSPFFVMFMQVPSAPSRCSRSLRPAALPAYALHVATPDVRLCNLIVVLNAVAGVHVCQDLVRKAVWHGFLIFQ
jgi:hypothetical protein